MDGWGAGERVWRDIERGDRADKQIYITTDWEIDIIIINCSLTVALFAQACVLFFPQSC